MNSVHFLDYRVYDNSLFSWAVFLGLTIGCLVVLGLLKKVLISRLGVWAQKTETDLDDFAIELLSKTKGFFFVVVSIYAASHYLNFSLGGQKLMHAAMVIGCLLQVAIWGSQVVDFSLERMLRKREANGQFDPTLATIIPTMRFLARFALYLLILLLGLQNLGFDVTALIAGLGVGGIAIALAVQNILGDLFSSLSIVLDKPFVLGDTITVGSVTGSVEKIGLKTTRIRSVSGEQVVFSNSDLLKGSIQNFKRMNERRVVFSFGVTYETPAQLLRGIPETVQKIVESQKEIRFDRTHWKSFGDSALIFEVVYYVLTADYKIYMDIQQSINMQIFEAFQKQKIDFAYPTQMVIHRNSVESASKAAHA